MPAKPVDKQVSIAVSRDSSYNAPAYDKTVATLQVYVFTVKNHRQHIVWRELYNAMPVKDYPVTSRFCGNIQVKNIHDNREQLFVTYIITHNTNGFIMRIENGTQLLNGKCNGMLSIKI